MHLSLTDLACEMFWPTALSFLSIFPRVRDISGHWDGLKEGMLFWMGSGCSDRGLIHVRGESGAPAGSALCQRCGLNLQSRGWESPACAASLSNHSIVCECISALGVTETDSSVHLLQLILVLLSILDGSQICFWRKKPIIWCWFYLSWHWQGRTISFLT